MTCEQISCSGVVWLISRRFSDFDQLHCKLESVFHDSLTVRLPEKQWFGRFDPNFISKRQAGLQLYLDGLLQVPGILDDRSLQHFFEHISETDRWQLIVEKAEHALIDISEVPEPLEVDQARQKRAEVLAAYAATSSEADGVPNALKTAPASLDTVPVPHAATSQYLAALHDRLDKSLCSKQTIAVPNDDLIAFMPPPVDTIVAAH
ncbi:hypothetical protein B5M09_012908 [Aphanomyces astaci]|uniref:PX domain-containing protein n=1 Tax=Aphanomyces astaci TaxID=112090 RepID=A0A3R7Y1Z6_APHAT|nr:hypothetical protein B5M09_012908 [Aphanomyces astaci]